LGKDELRRAQLSRFAKVQRYIFHVVRLGSMRMRGLDLTDPLWHTGKEKWFEKLCGEVLGQIFSSMG
jgi:hypothetical protein